MFRLDGKTALVTGASQGIGEGIARRLAEYGARVVLAARSVDKLERLAGEIRGAGGEAHPLALDVADAEAVPARLKELPEDFSDIAILVNNAGITADNLIPRMGLEDWERVLRTNLTGAYALSRAVLRGMMRKRWGRIISIASVIGLMGNVGQTNYAAAKAGLMGFSKSLAREVGRFKITVNVVAPGYVATAMTDDLPESNKKDMEREIVLKRIGSVDDIAGPVVFLAGDAGGYITGEVLNVSGGLYI